MELHKGMPAFPPEFQGFIPVVIAQNKLVVGTNEPTSTVLGMFHNLLRFIKYFVRRFGTKDQFLFYLNQY